MGIISSLLSAGAAGARVLNAKSAEQERQADRARQVEQDERERRRQALMDAISLSNAEVSARRLEGKPFDPSNDPVVQRKLYEREHGLEAPPKPAAPVVGSPEWEKAQETAAKIRAKYRPSSTPKPPAIPRDAEGRSPDQVRQRRRSEMEAEIESTVRRKYQAYLDRMQQLPDDATPPPLQVFDSEDTRRIGRKYGPGVMTLPEMESAAYKALAAARGH